MGGSKGGVVHCNGGLKRGCGSLCCCQAAKLKANEGEKTRQRPLSGAYQDAGASRDSVTVGGSDVSSLMVH